MPSIHAAAIAALVMLVPLCPSCAPGTTLVQETLPAESAITDILRARSARVRSIYCEIIVEPVDDARWKDLMRATAYRKPARSPVLRRTPPVTAFLVLLKNTVNAPVRLEKARVTCAGSVMEPLGAKASSERFRSPAYAWCDFGRLLSFRRFVGEHESLRKIDFDRDTIESSLDFIPPQDSVIGVLVFERIPAETRRFKLHFSIAAMGSVREVAVEFSRRESRAAAIKKKETGADDDE